MLRFRLLVIGFLSATGIFGQVFPGDSLSVRFEMKVDTAGFAEISPIVQNRAAEAAFFYYQLRITDTGKNAGEIIKRDKGRFFMNGSDTTNVTSIRFPFSKDDDFTAYFYVLDEEFVIAGGSWTLAEIKGEMPKKKPKPVFLAKDDFEIDGLVFNETRTRSGREFYAKFTELWQAPQGKSGYWINIRELLAPGRFTILSINLNNKELFQRFLQPRTEYINALAQQTADYILSLLQDGNFDGGLTQEDLMGKGIE